MKKILILIMFCQLLKGQKTVILDTNDLFIISQFQKTEYQSFADLDSRLPANLSSVHYYVDINGETDSVNIVDINYLYLHGFHKAGVYGGELSYLLTRKNIPVGKRNHNVRSSRTVDYFSDIYSISSVSFGYWQIDPTTNRIILVFRDRTKIWNMDNFRIFGGVVLNKNIYLTKSMNSKDLYLFADDFNHHKSITVKLPLDLENVFYADTVTSSDTTWLEATLKGTLPVEQRYKNQLIDYSRQQKILDTLTIKERQSQKNTTHIHTDVPISVKSSKWVVTIKYWYFRSNRAGFEKNKMEFLNYDRIQLKFLEGENDKYVLLEATDGETPSYNMIKTPNYRQYYNTKNMREFINIHVVDPYDEDHIFTFKIRYTGQKFIPRTFSRIWKKIADS